MWIHEFGVTSVRLVAAVVKRGAQSHQWKAALLSGCIILNSSCRKPLLRCECHTEHLTFLCCWLLSELWRSLKRFSLGSQWLTLCFLWFLNRSSDILQCCMCFFLLPVSLVSSLSTKCCSACVSSGSEELKRMAHSKARATDGKVTYPPGVKEISDKISKEEMVRRLKVSLVLLLWSQR